MNRFGRVLSYVVVLAFLAIVALGLPTAAVAEGVAVSAPPAAVPDEGSGFHSLVPVRVLDSRTANGGWNAPLSSGTDRDLQITGVGGANGVPSGAAAVVANVTVTSGSAGSFVTVWPSGVTKPTSSNVNFAAGQTIPNLVVAKLSDSGQIRFSNAVGSVHVVVDVVGYYAVGSGDGFTGLTPLRVLDSRTTNGGWNAPLSQGQTRAVQITGVGGASGVPAGASAVVVNATVTAGTLGSFVTIWPEGVARPPAASNLNFGVNQTIPNLVMAKLSASGKVNVYNALGSVHVVLDVVGYYDGSPTAGRFHPIVPNRILDSRTGNGGHSSPWGPAATRSVAVAGTASVPTEATGVIMNTTVTQGTQGSFLTAFPSGVTRPSAASNVNFAPGETIPNLVAVKTGTAGKVDLYNHLGSVHVIADAVGYFAPPVDTPVVFDPPPLDPTIPTGIYAGTRFIYEGPGAPQQGVVPGTIKPERVAVVRGTVQDSTGTPVAGANVEVFDHPEYGHTTTRADGQFDLAVNGGGQLTVRFSKPGLLSADRTIDTQWHGWAFTEPLVMVAEDPAVTAIDLDAPGMQVAAGSVVTDADGSRQAAIAFPAATTAQMVFPDGSTKPITDLGVRITEFTVGDRGPEAMPAQLPPASAYTYAFTARADEAVAAGAADVVFDQPVPMYVDNFLGFPVGTSAPLGEYDLKQARWVPHDSGLVIGVLSEAGGHAVLDVAGQGNPATPAALTAQGITAAELIMLAGRYDPGDQLIRVRLPHFDSFWDINWGFEPSGAGTSNAEGAPEGGPNDSGGKCAAGSIIRCEDQSLLEQVSVAGTPFSLTYDSKRVAGRTAENELDIPLTGAAVPDGLLGVRVEVEVAGQRFEQRFDASPNQTFTYVWDGLDAYGRKVEGAAQASVRTGYVYGRSYTATGRFGYNGNGTIITTTRDGDDVTVWSGWSTTPLSRSWVQSAGLGEGWSLSPHHGYEPDTGTLVGGDGTFAQLGASYESGTIQPEWESGYCFAKCEIWPSIQGAVAPDGSVYHVYPGAGGAEQVRFRRPDGSTSVVAGSLSNCTDPADPCGDGGPATQARLANVTDIALGPDGSVVLVDGTRLRRVDPSGTIDTLIRICVVDGPGCDTARLGGATGHLSAASLLTVGPDGSIYFGDLPWQDERRASRIWRIDPSGQLARIVGPAPGDPGTPCPDNLCDGLRADAVAQDTAAIAVSGDGRVFVSLGGADARHRAYEIGADGQLERVAGRGTAGACGNCPMSQFDGHPALDADFVGIDGLLVTASGRLYLRTGYGDAIRSISDEGLLLPVAGTSAENLGIDPGTPAQRANVDVHSDLLEWPTGEFGFTAVGGGGGISPVRVVPPTGHVGDIIRVPAADGSLVNDFDPSGRHLVTRHPATGQVLVSFGYTPTGLLASITDADGNVTTVERDSAGGATAIVGPFGHRTGLAMGAGKLASITTPVGEASAFSYGAGGLVSSMVDPRGGTHSFTYDDRGRLASDTLAGGGTITLSRALVARGFEVSVADPLGRATKHRFDHPGAGGYRRTTIEPDGTTTETVFGSDMVTVRTAADGTVTTSTMLPDPVLGAIARYPSKVVVKTPSGLTSEVTEQRSATPDVLLGAADRTDTVTRNGKVRTLAYTAASRTALATSAEGRTRTSVLDPKGRPISVAESGFAPVSFAYDAKGRLSSSKWGTGAGARTTAYAYGSDGLLSSLADPAGRVTAYTRDADGRVTQTVLPGNRTVSTAYDEESNVTSITPPNRPAHGFSYDANGSMNVYSPPALPGAGATTSTYNAARQPTGVTLPDGRTLGYTYDPAGRLVTTATPDGPLSVAYDTAGRVATASDPGGVVNSYDYDGFLSIRETWSAPINTGITRTFDTDFRIASDSAPGAAAITYAYDDDDLLTGTGQQVLTRSATSGLIATTALGVTSETFSFNQFGELTQQVGKVSGANAYAATYTYDALGRVLTRNTTIGGVATVTTYTYDEAGRIASAAAAGVTTTYTYDANGNRLTRTQGATTETATFDNQDRVVNYDGATYSYNGAGQLASITKGLNVTTYDYDVRGNLRSVSLPNGDTVSYQVDAADRRVGRSLNGSTRRWIYDGALAPVAELDGTGAVVARFVYGERGNVPAYLIKGADTFQLVTDHLGSVRLVINTATGAIAQRLDYDEYGRVTNDTNPGFQPFGYAGGIYDPTTSLVRFGARDYDPMTGRWTTKDPIGFNGGTTNLYEYVAGDPMNATDATGLLIAPLVWWAVRRGAMLAIATVGPEVWDHYKPAWDNWRRESEWDRMHLPPPPCPTGASCRHAEPPNQPPPADWPNGEWRPGDAGDGGGDGGGAGGGGAGGGGAGAGGAGAGGAGGAGAGGAGGAGGGGAGGGGGSSSGGGCG